MASNRDRQSGFSLLELIIVLMVMVSLLAIVWPNLQRPLGRTTLSEAAQTLRGAIDDSRYQAITTGTPIFVQLRQGEGVLRAGTFDNFMSDDVDIAAANSTPSLQPATIVRRTDAPDQPGLQTAIRTWKLPEAVVVSDVRWTLEAPVEEFGAEFTEDSTVAEDSAVAEVSTDTMLERDVGAAEFTWWLPLVASGRGRDAAIVLLDTSLNEEITVTFASATGALEIVR